MIRSAAIFPPAGMPRSQSKGKSTPFVVMGKPEELFICGLHVVPGQPKDAAADEDRRGNGQERPVGEPREDEVRRSDAEGDRIGQRIQLSADGRLGMEETGYFPVHAVEEHRKDETRCRESGISGKAPIDGGASAQEVCERQHVGDGGARHADTSTVAIMEEPA